MYNNMDNMELFLHIFRWIAIFGTYAFFRWVEAYKPEKENPYSRYLKNREKIKRMERRRRIIGN